MSTFIILVLLVVTIVGILAWQRSKSQSASGSSDSTQSLPLTIQNVGPGGVLHLSWAGSQMLDLDVEIVGRHLYREDGFEWFELEGDSSEGKIWIEVEEDDELEISVSLRQLKLAELGLNPEKLDEIERRDEGKIELEGRTYEYEDWGKAQFLRNGSHSRPESFKYWDFESEDGKWFLGIERWGEREYLAYLSQAVSPSHINIFRLGTEDNAVN